MNEEMKQTIDLGAGGVTMGAYMSWIPEVTAVASLAWVILRIYETETVKALIDKYKKK